MEFFPPTAARLERKLSHRTASSLCLLRLALACLTPDTCHLRPFFFLCLLLAPASLFAARGLYKVREVKPNVFVWIPEDVLDQDGDTRFSRSGSAGFVITRDGVVVINTTNTPFHARELLYEIRRRTDAPVRYVINTDSHGDQVLGNEVFVDQRATIISTAAAQTEMSRYQKDLVARVEEDWRMPSRMRGIHITLPAQTFDGDSTLALGGVEIKLLNLSQGHSAGDLAVSLPQAKVLFLGCLFENHYLPRFGSGDVRRWIEILKQVETWDVDVYVPGHGPPGTKKDVAEFRGFLEWLAAEVQSRLGQKKSLADVKRELIPFEQYPWRAPELAGPAVEAVYQEFAGP